MTLLNVVKLEHQHILSECVNGNHVLVKYKLKKPTRNIKKRKSNSKSERTLRMLTISHTA